MVVAEAVAVDVAVDVAISCGGSSSSRNSGREKGRLFCRHYGALFPLTITKLVSINRYYYQVRIP